MRAFGMCPAYVQHMSNLSSVRSMSFRDVQHTPSPSSTPVQHTSSDIFSIWAEGEMSLSQAGYSIICPCFGGVGPDVH